MARRTGDREAQAGDRRRTRHAVHQLTRALKNLPPYDIGDPVAMDERCELVMDMHDEAGLMPTLGSLAIGLGTTIDGLTHLRAGESFGWAAGRLTPDSARVLAKNLAILEGAFDANFENGAYANPVTGIFASKNNYGWRDVREVQQVSVSVEATPEEIAERYVRAIPQHRDEHGEVHRLQDGITAQGATRVALALMEGADRREAAARAAETAHDEADEG